MVILNITLLLLAIGLLLAMAHYYHKWTAADLENGELTRECNVWRLRANKAVAEKQDLDAKYEKISKINGKLCFVIADRAVVVNGGYCYRVVICRKECPTSILAEFEYRDDEAWAKLQAEELAEQINDKL